MLKELPQGFDDIISQKWNPNEHHSARQRQLKRKVAVTYKSGPNNPSSSSGLTSGRRVIPDLDVLAR